MDMLVMKRCMLVLLVKVVGALEAQKLENFWIPVSDQVLRKNLNTNCMLIVLSTKVASNVATELNQSSRCYTAENKLPQGTDILERCELVILCEEYAESSIGKSILLGLREAFTLTENPSLKVLENTSLKDIVLSMDKMSIRRLS